MSNPYRDVGTNLPAQKMINIHKAEVSFYVRGSKVCMKRTFTGSTCWYESISATVQHASGYLRGEQELWSTRNMVRVMRDKDNEVWMPFHQIVSIHIKYIDFMVPTPASAAEAYQARSY